MKRLLFMLLCSSSLFAFVGFGANVNLDGFLYPSYSSTATGGEINYMVNGEGFDNAGGLSLYAYLDFLPIVDLEANLELVGNSYKFATYSEALGSTLLLSEGDFPWARVSFYFTARKKLIGAKVPFLAKVQIYAGGGINSHTVTPQLEVDFFTEAFGTGYEDALSQEFSQTEIVDKLVNYVSENATQHSGIHMQVGAQVKVLVFSLFANARYTMAKDVIPDKAGFPSMNAGLAFGF
jgi:hypothetical protein